MATAIPRLLTASHASFLIPLSSMQRFPFQTIQYVT